MVNICYQCGHEGPDVEATVDQIYNEHTKKVENIEKYLCSRCGYYEEKKASVW